MATLEEPLNPSDIIQREFNTILEMEKYKLQKENILANKTNGFILDLQDFLPDVADMIINDFISLMKRDDLVGMLRSILSVERFKAKLPFDISLKWIGIINVENRKRIRSLSSLDLGKLMNINGIILSLTSPQSIITKAAFDCIGCGEIILLDQTSDELLKPAHCPSCNTRKFTLNEQESKWSDYQEATIQENPDELKMGVIPRSMKVRIIGSHLIDKIKPGETVDLTCVMTTVQVRKRGRERIFIWCLNANYFDVLTKDHTTINLTEEDIEILREWSRHEQIQEILMGSVFPSIEGNEAEKEGLILAMFGGVDKKMPDILLRGTINVLMVGDPSTAKTAMLVGVTEFAPKAIYTSGKGSSGVGLTAAAINEDGQWRLEAGALVLADGGICCIDEIEKMDDKDRTNVHEAMAKQTVSINKANIHTTLRARTTVLAAGNPKTGKISDKLLWVDNISLPPALISRFDLIYLMEDIPNKEKDKAIAEKIVKLYGEESGTTGELPIMEKEWIRKYILYAKSITPKISPEASKRLIEYYVDIRNKYAEEEDMPIQITPRQLQGLIRLTQARARLTLEEVATIEHAEKSIALMKATLDKVITDPITGEWDSGITEMGGTLRKGRKKAMIIGLIPTIHKRPEGMTIEDLMESLENVMDEFELEKLLAEMTNFGQLMNPVQGAWTRL